MRISDWSSDVCSSDVCSSYLVIILAANLLRGDETKSGDRRGAIGAGRDIALDIAALADTPIGDGDDSAFAILAIPGDPASRRAGMHRAGGLIEVGKARIVRLEHRPPTVAQLSNAPLSGGRPSGVRAEIGRAHV